MLLKCKDWRRFWCKKAAPKLPQWPSYGNFCKVTQNPHFLRKCKGGTKGNLLKDRPQGSPRLKGPKALWRTWYYPLISMHLKIKDWKRFWRKKPAPKVPEWPNYGNFCKVSQKPNFLKKCKWGTRRNFSKIAQKVALA